MIFGWSGRHYTALSARGKIFRSGDPAGQVRVMSAMYPPYEPPASTRTRSSGEMSALFMT